MPGFIYPLRELVRKGYQIDLIIGPDRKTQFRASPSPTLEWLSSINIVGRVNFLRQFLDKFLVFQYCFLGFKVLFIQRYDFICSYLTVKAGKVTRTVTGNSLKKGIVDTTDQPRNGQARTDVRPYSEVHTTKLRVAKEGGLVLPQNYHRMKEHTFRKHRGSIRVRPSRRAKKVLKSLKGLIGRVMWDVEWKMFDHADHNKRILILSELVLGQTRLTSTPFSTAITRAMGFPKNEAGASLAAPGSPAAGDPPSPIGGSWGPPNCEGVLQDRLSS